MEYPRTITLTHPKLIKLEQEKGQIIEEGRAITDQISGIELEMGKIDVRLQTEEAKVDISDLRAEGDALIKSMDEIAKDYAEKIKVIETKIYDRMAAHTDPELRKAHERLTTQKEELEKERNKKALKAQKLKDRIIPLARRLMAPFIQNEYEDYNDIQLKDGVMVGTIFSHLDQWDQRFKEKKKKSEIDRYKK